MFSLRGGQRDVSFNSRLIIIQSSGFPLVFQVFNCKTDQKKDCKAITKQNGMHFKHLLKEMNQAKRVRCEITKKKRSLLVQQRKKIQKMPSDYR